MNTNIQKKEFQKGDIFQIPGFIKWYFFSKLEKKPEKQGIIHCCFPIKCKKKIRFQETIFPEQTSVIKHKLREVQLKTLQKNNFYLTTNRAGGFSIRKVIKITPKKWCKFKEIFSTNWERKENVRMEKSKLVFHIPKECLK